MKKAVIIYNPVAGNDKGSNYNNILRNRLEAEFDEVISIATQKEKDAIHLATDASDEGVHSIFVIGGDGTVNEVTQGILASNKSEKPILGIVPAGTFNGLSRILGFPQNSKNAIKAFDFNKTLKMDVGKFSNNYFNMIFSIGDVPEALHNVTNEEKSAFSIFAYAYNIARDAIKNCHYPMEITTEEETITGDFSHVVVMTSAAIYGTPLLSGIKRNDGNLHLFVLKESTLFEKMSLLPDLIAGKLKDNDKIKYYKCKNIKIKSLSGQINTDVDGDKADPLPSNIIILEQALETYSLV